MSTRRVSRVKGRPRCHALIAGAALTLAGGAAFAGTPALQDLGGVATVDPDPTTIYVAREFLTMNPEQPTVEAVAVRGGKFVAAGTRAEVDAAVGGGARVDETFADQVGVAGFIEQHVHPVLAALTMSHEVISIEDWDTMDGFSPAVRDARGYRERLEAALAAHADKSVPFVTWGYHHYFHGQMSRRLLDRLAPDFPVVVWHRSAHEFYLNSVALQNAGIDDAFVAGLSQSQQEQASLDRGHFFEQGALAILGRISPMVATPALFRRGLEFTEQYYHRNGITLACEPGGFFSRPMQDAINAVYGDDATPFNHCFMADGKTFAARNPKDAGAMIKDSEQLLDWGKGRTWYLPRQVKLLLDGAIYSQLMQMKDGYTDGHDGAWIMDPPVFAYAFQAYWDAGHQVHVHNNGDAGLEVLVGELEKAMARKPRKDHRTVLVHFGFASPELVRRWGKLGGIVSSNPYYVTALAGRYAKLGIGPERSQNMVPMKDVVDAGIRFSFHSDMPMAPARPLQLAWSAVNRTTAEGPVAGPEHTVTVEQALRAITIEAAYSIRQEQRVGSIEVGKDANLTVLEQSPYEVAPAQIKDIGVWGTMLEGRVQPGPPALRRATEPPVDAEVETAAVPAGDGIAFDPVYNLRLASSRLGNELGLCADPGAVRDGLVRALLTRMDRYAVPRVAATPDSLDP